MVYITRREYFCSAHRLRHSHWTEEENNAVFGGCANPNWHGHNYELIVTVKGTPSKTTGFVINLKELSVILQKKVINKVDHKNINLDVPFMQDVMPTTENFAIKIWEQIENEIAELGATLHCVKLQETAKNSIEYYGK